MVEGAPRGETNERDGGGGDTGRKSIAQFSQCGSTLYLALGLVASVPAITEGLARTDLARRWMLPPSFSLAHIAVFIETEFRVLIPDDDLTVENMDTLGQMADRICRDLRGGD